LDSTPHYENLKKNWWVGNELGVFSMHSVRGKCGSYCRKVKGKAGALLFQGPLVEVGIQLLKNTYGMTV
jgi:hypothetical protein